MKKIAKEYDGAEDFINNSIEEICSQEKLSAEEIIYFLLAFCILCFFVIFLTVK